jgi:hypothetical protein
VRAKRSLRRLIVVLGVIALPLASSAGFDDFVRDGNTKFRIVVSGGGAEPTTETLAATAVAATTATLEGQAIPNGVATTGWFRYDDADPGSCDDSFGTRAPGASGTDIGDGGTEAPFDENITGLTAGVTYYYCAISENAIGKTFGDVVSFRYQIPVVVTSAATAVAVTTVTLNGTGNPAGVSSEGWFRYDTVDPGTCDDVFGTRIPAVSGGTALGSGSSPVAFDENVTGLTDATTYYFCAIAENSNGKGYGTVQSFTTNNPIEFLSTASSIGLGSIGNSSICSNAAYTAVETGAQAWCFEGDGDDDNFTFTRTGASTTETEQECPNGIDCSNVTRQRMVSGSQNGWITTETPTEVTSDFACWIAYRAGVASTTTILAKGPSTANNFRIRYSSMVLADFRTTAPAVLTATGATTQATGAIQFVVVNVDQGASGAESGNMRIYLNDMSAADGSVSLAGATMATEANAWSVGYRTGTSAVNHDLFAAGCTQQLLTEAQRSALKDAILGKLQDRRAVATITTTRSTSVDCPASGGTRASGIGPNRPCVAGDGSGNARLRTHFAAFNQALQSETIDNASWLKLNNTFAAPSVTADQVLDPSGNKTADQVDFPAISTGAAKRSYLRMDSNTGIANAQPFSAGVWLRISAGTGKVYLWQKYSTGSQTLTSTACNLTTTWSFCSNVNDTSHGGTNAHQLFIGFDNDALGQGADTLAAQTIYVSKVQWHSISALAMYCPTTTAAVQCAGNQHSFTKPSAELSNTTGCMGATITPTYIQAVPEGYLMRFGAAGYMSYDNTDLKCSDGTNTASLALPNLLNTTSRVVCTWTGATLTVKQIGGSSDSDTYDGDMFAAGDVTTYVGHNNNANYFTGWMSRITFDDTTTGCD